MISEAPLLLGVLVGIFLRIYQISLQIPADDEWHAFHALLTGRSLQIAAHFGVADYSIPMALFFRLAYLYIGLSEVVTRFPVVIAGFAMLIVGPWVARIWVNRSVSVSFAWLLAVSPILVYFSRYSRPYIVTGLLSFVAAFAFFEWWNGSDKPWKLVYATSAILVPYFHLSSLPFVAATLVYGSTTLLFSVETQRRGWKEWLSLALLVGGGLIFLLGPPLLLDHSALTGKLAQQRISYETLQSSAQLVAGSATSFLVVTVLLLAVVGYVILIRTKLVLAPYLLFLVIFQVGSNLLVGPSGLHVPIVFVRYALPVVPLLLFFVAIAAGSFERRFLRIPDGTLGAFLGMVLLFLGPLPQIYYYPNNWTNHGVFQYCYDRANRTFHYEYSMKPKFVSEFYRELGESSPGMYKILEAPWYYSFHNNPFPYLQQVHRQRMMIGFIDDPAHWDRAGEYPPSFSRMRFQSYLHLSQYDALARRGVDYVVLHKDLASEVPNSSAREPVDMGHWIEKYRSLFGEPFFEDATIVVFKTRNRQQAM